MFMFWNKRAVLSKRLLKAKVRGEHETECETQEDTLSRYNIPETNRTTQQQQQQQQQQPHNHHEHHQNRHQQHQQDRSGAEIREPRVQKSSSSSSSSSSGSSNSSSWYTSGNRGSVATRFHQGCCGGEISHDEDDEIVRGDVNQRVNSQTNNRVTKCKELLKSLKEHQLEMLLNVVESYGADFGSCVLVPRKQEQQQHRQSPRRLNPIEALKQQEATTCNRRQRCPLASSNVLENTTRRPPHRHILRSRRHNPGTRCTRCVNTHGNNAEDNGQQQRADFATTCFNEEDEQAIEGRDNEANRRLVEDTKAHGIPVDDHRQERPAWCSNNEDVPELGHIANDGNAAAARPERDRCRRAHGKNGRSTGTRKRRDSPNNDDYTDGNHAFDNNPESRHDDPHLLSCQIWRWPDLANSAELKKLPVCHSSKDPVYICCNPYHWSRLCKPESPPPPYCLIPDRLRPEDRAPSEISGDYRHCGLATSPQPHSGSLTTNGEGGNEMGQKEWCTLAYWELGGRVGRLYPVEPSTVNVFDSLHDGDGLCLSTLAENHVASPAVLRTRSKIGLGLMLSQESDGVWAYNRSDSPIFVNSPTLDDPESRTLLVYRVPPGFCLNIFDRSKTMKLPSSRCCPGQSSSISTGSFNSGPVDVNSVRISFAKGWGPKYSRQEVTSCPCWLEVLLAPCR